jgi:hypothetical protein
MTGSDERSAADPAHAGWRRRAFETFFNGYFPRIYRFALPRLNGDVMPPGDRAVHARKAIRKSFRGESDSSLVCQICRNEIVDHIRAGACVTWC